MFAASGEFPFHCHREKQQGFISLHSAVSHCVNEVGLLVFKRKLARWLYQCRLTLAEVEPSNGFGGWLTYVGRHFRLIVLHAMPEVTTFWEMCHPVCSVSATPSKAWLIGFCNMRRNPVRCHRENLQGFASLCRFSQRQQFSGGRYFVRVWTLGRSGLFVLTYSHYTLVHEGLNEVMCWTARTNVLFPWS